MCSKVSAALVVSVSRIRVIRDLRASRRAYPEENPTAALVVCIPVWLSPVPRDISPRKRRNFVNNVAGVAILDQNSRVTAWGRESHTGGMYGVSWKYLAHAKIDHSAENVACTGTDARANISSDRRRGWRFSRPRLLVLYAKRREYSRSAFSPTLEYYIRFRAFKSMTFAMFWFFAQNAYKLTHKLNIYMTNTHFVIKVSTVRPTNFGNTVTAPNSPLYPIVFNNYL